MITLSRAYKRFCPDIFMQSVYVRGEIQGHDTAIIEGQVVPTMDNLIDHYGADLVLQAANETGGDMDEMVTWLEAQNG